MKCDFCGAVCRVHKIRGTEVKQCRACYVKKMRQDVTKYSVCENCGKGCYAEYRSEQNDPLCQSCYYRAKHYCYVCNKLGTYFEGRCKDCHEQDLKRLKNCNRCGDLFEFRYDFRTVCRKCSSKIKKTRNKGICSSCKKERELSTKLENGDKICLYCYKKYYMTHSPCEICGNVTFCFKNRRLGKSICVACSNRIRYLADWREAR